MRLLSKSFIVTLCLAIVSLPASAGFFGPSKVILTGGGLDVRSKAAAVGGFVLGFVLSSAVASSGGMGGVANAQQLHQNVQANMQIASAFNTNFQTAFTSIVASQAAKPSAQVAKEGPIFLVAQQLAASLAQAPAIKVQALASKEKASPTDLQLRIVQKAWLLDFSMASSDYTLSHDIEVSLYQKQSDSIFFLQDCKGPSAEKRPQEEWEKNDFSAIAKAAVETGEQCAKKIITALGLLPAKVLPEVLPAPVDAISPLQTAELPAPVTEQKPPATSVVAQNAAPQSADATPPTASAISTAAPVATPTVVEQSK
jgi:hypothetical protein